MISSRDHSSSAAPVRRPLSPSETVIRELGDRLVQAQRPLRILHAVRWDDAVAKQFFAAGANKLPAVTPEYYRARPLLFSPEQKLAELRQIETDTRSSLGRDHAAGRILLRMCDEFKTVVRLLQARGTPRFGLLSAQLFGRTSEGLGPGEASLSALCRSLGQYATAPDASVGSEEPELDSAQAVQELSARMAGYFHNPSSVSVRLADNLAADAAAGCDYLKLRRDARFTRRDLRLLEVHEGWVHLGTNLNGQNQPVCSFLSRGAPSSTLTQEGLAVLTEILARAAHPERWRKLALRVEGIAMAEAGADFLNVYRRFLNEGLAPSDCYHLAARVFRGGLPAGGGPFTKDLCYVRGFLLVARHLQRTPAPRRGQALALLFCGKTALVDWPALDQLADDGLIAPPRFIPPPFANSHVLSQWLGSTSTIPLV